MSEFPNEELVVSDVGRLFCKACRETLCVKRSTISNHIKSTKHVESKREREIQEREIQQALNMHVYLHCIFSLA